MTQRRLVYIDIEADALLDQATNIWVVGCKDVDTDEEFIFTKEGRYGYPSIEGDFREFMKGVSKFTGHNLIAYDLEVLRKLLGVYIEWDVVEWDTLILSKIINFEVEGGHGLKNLAEKAGGTLKKEYNGGFEDLNLEMIEYNRYDLRSGVSVLKWLLALGKGKVPLKVLKEEHEAQAVCASIHNNGFHLDYDRAENLVLEMSASRDALGITLSETHPKMPKSNRVVKYKLKADGEMTVNTLKPLKEYGYTSEDIVGDYELIDWITFNPSSRQQIVWQLLQKGWKPSKFTDKGQPIVDEAVLETLQDTFPEAHEIITYLMLEKRIAQVSKWLELYNPRTERVHGFINAIGARTGRASHSDPNLAQVPGVRKDKNDNILHGVQGTYNFECRSCWRAPEGYSIVGVDASAIQLVILASVMNDSVFTKAVETGKSSDGTDVHTLNRNILRDVVKELTGKDPSYFSRADAKRFVYAFLLGAGGPKVAEICGVPAPLGAKIKDLYLKRLSKLGYYIKELHKGVRAHGIVKNIDGRLFPCDDPHFSLAFILQGYESTIMKKAMIKTHRWIASGEVPGIKLVAWVHDEFQMEVKKGYEELVIQKVVGFIEEVGRELNLACKLTGSGGYGASWAESH